MQASLGEQLREALNKWDKEEKEQTAQQAQPASYQKTSPFQVTNNLNRETFAHIQRMPGTRKQVTEDLINKGFKLGSVSAVIGHMIRQGVVSVDGQGILRVTTPHYVPLKSYKTLQNMKKRQEQARKKVIVNVRAKTTRVEEEKGEEKRPVSSSSAGIAALSAPPASPAPKPWSVYGLLETLSILQARDLYDELKKIFEVNK